MSCTFWLMLKISTSGSSCSSFQSLIRIICNCTEYIVLYYTGLVLLPAPAAFPAGVDPNRGSEETVRSRDQLKVQACCDQLKA